MMAAGRNSTGAGGSAFLGAVSDDLPGIRKMASGWLSIPAALMPSVIFEVLKTSTRVSLLASTTNKRFWPASKATPRGCSMPESDCGATRCEINLPEDMGRRKIVAERSDAEYQDAIVFLVRDKQPFLCGIDSERRGPIHGRPARTRRAMLKVRLAEHVSRHVVGDRVVGIQCEHQNTVIRGVRHEQVVMNAV
jgi:hypothetical protein